MILSLFVLPAALGLAAMCAFVSDFEEDMRVVGASLGVTALAGDLLRSKHGTNCYVFSVY